MRILALGAAVVALGACGGDNTNEMGVVFGGDAAEDAAMEEAYADAEVEDATDEEAAADAVDADFDADSLDAEDGEE